MNLAKLLTNLRLEHARINAAIQTLAPYVETPLTAAAIVRHAKQSHTRKLKPTHAMKGRHYTKANPHWMQRPENAAKVRRMARLRAAKRSA